MNYNNGDFNYSSLLTDKKYRSRVILLVYALIFIALIIFVRIGVSNSNSSNTNIENEVAEDDKNVNNNVNEDNTNISELDDMFSYIDMKNYNFEYILSYNGDTFYAKGKKFSDKYDFILSNGSNNIQYLSKGNITMAKSDFDGVESYQEVKLPYYYINYFDAETIKSIVASSKRIDDSSYEITNKELSTYADSNYNLLVENENAVNNIFLTMKNGKVVEINLELTSFVLNESSDFKINMKFSDFGLIDDFEINFE